MTDSAAEDAARTRVAVLGSPIAHSKSPALHSAAYRELGLDWTYSAVEVTSAGLEAFLETTDRSWRGLSLTMPLKRNILPFLVRRDDVVRLAGGANTVLFTNDGLAGFNTDVYGIVAALRQSEAADLGSTKYGSGPVRSVLIIGAGATASSAVVAASELGAERVRFATRTPSTAAAVRDLSDRLGMATDVRSFAEGTGVADATDLVISTVPGSTAVPMTFPDALIARAPLLDVAYDPWPTDLAARWLAGGGRVVSGLEMLLNQAVAQVRIFVLGDPRAELPDEARVVAAMRKSVGLGPVAR